MKYIALGSCWKAIGYLLVTYWLPFLVDKNNGCLIRRTKSFGIVLKLDAVAHEFFPFQVGVKAIIAVSEYPCDFQRVIDLSKRYFEIFPLFPYDKMSSGSLHSG